MMTNHMRYLLLILLLVFGCFDEYSPIEQGDVYGCTDMTACNFDVDANNYRTASGSYWIKRGGTNGDS